MYAGVEQRSSSSLGAAAGAPPVAATVSGLRHVHMHARSHVHGREMEVDVGADGIDREQVVEEGADLDAGCTASASDAVPLQDALKVLWVDRKNLRRYGALVGFTLFYTVYLVALFLQRDTRAAWEVQNAITRDIEASEFANVKDPDDFLDWLEGPFRDLALRYPGGIGRHNRVLLSPLVLQLRNAGERCKGQPRFDQEYPVCFTGPPIVEPRPAAMDLDYTDPANAEAARQLLRITRSMFDLPGEKLPEPGQEAPAAAPTGPVKFTPAEALHVQEMFGVAESNTRAGQESGFFPGTEIIGSLSMEADADAASFLADVELIRFLGYVGPNTRTVSVKFPLYNGHVRMAAVVEAKLGAAYSGNVQPSLATNVFRVELYSLPLDWFRLALELVVLAGVVAWLVSTVRSLVREHRAGNLKSKKHVAIARTALVDLADQLVFLAAIGLWVAIVVAASSVQLPASHSTAEADSAEESHHSHRDSIKLMGRLYADLDRVSALFRAYAVANSINIFFGLLRLYRLLHFQDRMGVLTRTLALCASDLMHLGGLIAFTLIAFGSMGTLLFGRYDIYFSDLGVTLATLSEYMLFIDMFDFDGIVEKEVGLQIVYHWVFGFIATYILVNLFLAIVYHFYEEARGEGDGGRTMLEDVAQVSRTVVEDGVARAGRRLGARTRGATLKQVVDAVKELSERRGPGGRTTAEDLACALRERYPHLSERSARGWAEHIVERARPRGGQDPKEEGEEGEGGAAKEAPDSAAAPLAKAAPIEERLGRVEEAVQRVERLLIEVAAAVSGNGGAGRQRPGPPVVVIA